MYLIEHLGIHTLEDGRSALNHASFQNEKNQSLNLTDNFKNIPKKYLILSSMVPDEAFDVTSPRELSEEACYIPALFNIHQLNAENDCQRQ